MTNDLIETLICAGRYRERREAYNRGDVITVAVANNLLWHMVIDDIGIQSRRSVNYRKEDEIIFRYNMAGAGIAHNTVVRVMDNHMMDTMANI